MTYDDPLDTSQISSKNPILDEVSKAGKNSTINAPKKKNKFLDVLGNIAGGVLNTVAPGLGSIIGGAITNSSSSLGTYSQMLSEQQKSFAEMQQFSQIQYNQQQQQQQQMMFQQQRQGSQMLLLQNRVSMQSQEFSTISNLLKSKHDTEMTAINNLKS